MATTPYPEDKYAFLFTGPTLGRFIKDLEGVADVLTRYYNYPPANIKVVLGSVPAVAPVLPAGVAVANIVDEHGIRAEMTAFAAAAAGPSMVDPGRWKTALLYFTGGGVLDAGVSKLVIDGGGGAASIDPPWLTARLNAFVACHVNIVMQQAHAGGFAGAVAASTLTRWSFTHAAEAGQDSFGNNALGSFFTHGWLRGLKLETLPPGTPSAGQYADELGAAHRLIALEEAMEFGKQIHDAMGFAPLSTPGYTGAGGPQVLGEPLLLIRDGSPSWWESEDIFLTHPNHPWVPAGDLYIPDAAGAVPPYNNTVNIRVRNIGTHPLRAYSLGIEQFKSGIGAVNALHTAADKIPAVVPMLPMDAAAIGGPDDVPDIYEWNSLFEAGVTHNCVKAEAKRLSTDVDFAWSVVANAFEGQRNTDEMTVVPAPPVPLPLPFLDGPLPFMKGFQEHIYGIENRFPNSRTYYVVFPKILEKYARLLDLDWTALPAGRQTDMVPLRVVPEPMPHIPIRLKARERRDLLLRVSVKPGVEMEEEIRLPFDILVEGDWGPDVRPGPFPGPAPIAGFTVAIRPRALTLRAHVLDARGETVVGARVLARSVNDLQGGVELTDRKGQCCFIAVNPDVYVLWAEHEKRRSSELTVVPFGRHDDDVTLKLTEHNGAGRKVRVVLERIKALDPGLKPKTITSIVVPDHDESRKQVKKLSASRRTVLFEGVVENRALSLRVTAEGLGQPILYRRDFCGNPASWYGEYVPANPGEARWALWYSVVPA